MSAPQRADAGVPDLAAMRLLQRIAALSNEASSFSVAIQAALDEVCAYTSWPVGHAYVLDAGDETNLAPTRQWHLDDPGRFRVFREVTEATPLRTGIGLPGRVLASSSSAWIADVSIDANFPRNRTGRDIVVRGAFAFPVLSGSTVVAVLEFFIDRPEPSDDDLLELMTYVGTQLGRVAERDAAAAALVAQAEHTRHLIRSAYDAFVSIDRFGTITDWNVAAESMFGWSRDEALGLPLADVIVPERYREAHLKGIERYLATGEGPVLNKRLELSALHRTGEEFAIELAIWPVGSGDAQAFCAFVRDITERKRFEENLVRAEEHTRESESRLLTAQQMAHVGSWEWDIASGAVTWSQQLYRNFGVDPAEFAPSVEAYMDLVHPDDREFVTSIISQALETLEPFEFEHRSIRPGDGDVRVHHCTGEVLLADGGATNMAGTNQDVTERVNAEQATREALVRLQELDRSKSQFVSSVSHELRTPLTSIIGYLELLTMTEPELDPDHQEMVQVIQRNSSRLLTLIEDLLTQSKIESGSFRVFRKYAPLAPIVSGAVQAVVPSAAERGISLELSMADDVGAVVGDPDQLERLILNLLTNAIKFTSQGSVKLDVRRDDAHVTISVADTGIGIPSDELPNLFSPFFRSTNAERTAAGTGLGLVIVKAIVDQHDGDIGIESPPGHGTTVTVRLPATNAPALSA